MVVLETELVKTEVLDSAMLVLVAVVVLELLELLGHQQLVGQVGTEFKIQ